jgi:hypothetical protein
MGPIGILGMLESNECIEKLAESGGSKLLDRHENCDTDTYLL